MLKLEDHWSPNKPLAGGVESAIFNVSAKHFGKREKQQITGRIQKEYTEEMTCEPNLQANRILFLNLTNLMEPILSWSLCQTEEDSEATVQ